ncbi:hypothetical protein [Massilia sp. Leaf139]|uniref:hypothetical protein n=1 Tax=Massilia sp. Leaf139 TaxID=1736272 RepID=UPI000A7EFCB7|nr:hypothetical protein [Massilia sp. Leaf139]
MFTKFLGGGRYPCRFKNQHDNKDDMDAIYIGTMVLFFALTWAFAHGCGKLGGK